MNMIIYAMAALSLLLAIMSIAETSIKTKRYEMNLIALSILCTYLVKEKGDCIIKGDKMTLVLTDTNGNINLRLEKRND